MKTILLSILIICSLQVRGKVVYDFPENGKIKDSVQLCFTRFEEKLQKLSITSNKHTRDIQKIHQINENLHYEIDSLKHVCDSLQKAQAADCTAINSQIKKVDSTLASTQSIVKNRTLWGGVTSAVILFALLVIFYCLTKRIKRGTSSIDEIRKVQDALQKAHIKMQEESVKLDNKMIELCEQQIRSTPTKIESKQTDYSLALKVADEIVRIELNLSRMDQNIKGYKQLAKGVQRIKDNFKANDYEIVDMLGKQYQPGMKAAVTFITDESLEPGQQIITRIIKPQVNYKQIMIQAAQIEVSQSE